jgi:hypothetical protein
MDIKSFGCSFIFGSDLPDDGFGTAYATPSKLIWPALYAQHLGYGYKCYARPGSGNLQIAERVLNQATNPTPALYVVGWTWIDRFDYANSATDKWQTIMPVDKDAVAKTYYRDIHSEYRDKLTTLMSMRLVIDTLKQKGYPFIMTYMDDLTFDTQWHTTPAVLELQDYVRPHMTQFEGKSFLEWSRSKGFPETKQWHPLEEAHRAGADYIIKVFDKQNINDQVQ